MNKDVIYVEPEDDITDIILKIENSKEKIVALVPPKKAGVFRSVVNIKLIAKSGNTSGKKIVLVTVDPSIMRLAGAAKIPVTKNLQTAPAIPEVTEEPVALKAETLVEESDGEVETEEDVEELLGDDEDKDSTGEKDEKTKKDEKSDAKEDEKEEKAVKKPAKKPEKSGNKFVAWFKSHKKLAICGGIGLVLLVIFLVWAFAIAPAATVEVAVKATSNNFSEAVTFTNTISDEKASEGKFYLEEKKIEDIKEVEFEATGKKNVGEKATGEVTVVATISMDGGTVQVKAGDSFTNSGLTFIADKGATMSFDGKDKSVCGNVNDNTTVKEFDTQGCKIYVKIPVTAAEAGSKYNISAQESGWNTTAPVAAYSTNAMSGGTDAEITVVQQADIDRAKEALASTDENENKEKLLSSVGENMLVIESSFKQTTGDAVATPGVGEEVKDGVKPKLKAVTTASVFVLDKTKVEEFISEKADLKDDQKIYEMKDPFIENFAQTSSGYTGKLKTTYLTGPKVTVSSIVDIVKGKGFGDAQHALKDIDGITDVHIKGSFPWVMSIPGDSNKITVEINVKDQNGTEVKIDAKDEEKKSDSEDDKGSNEEKEEKS
ncbi:hypothetical protein IKE82_02030 [Candidatus Saccharibacteria bacterium]|nr:hypothetical protein [Candidatus Saccharibacteria bacterium]